MPDSTVHHDLASRRQRRLDGQWLSRQARRRQWLPVLLLHMGDALCLILFLTLLAYGIASLALSGMDSAMAASPHWAVLGLMAGAAILRSGFRHRAEHAATRLASTVVTGIRERAMAASLSPAHRLFHGDNDAELGVRLSEELQQLKPWFRDYLPARAMAIFQPLLIVLIVLSLDWLAGLLLLLTAPLIPLFSSLIGLGTASLAETQQARLNRMGHHFLDRIRALPTLRLFRRADTETHAVGAAADAYRESSMRVLRVAFLSSAVLEFFSAIAIATLAIYIGLALLGYISFGPATALGFQAGLTILLLAPEFFQPLRRLASGYHQRAAAVAAVPRIRPLMDGGPLSDRPDNRPGTRQDRMAPDWPDAPDIRLDRVSAAWPDSDRLILDGLSMALPAGGWLAVQGPSGCGKSTLAAVLLGWLPLSSGRVFIAGRPLDALSETERRHNFAWLGQQPHLLPVSLRRNLDPAGRHADQALESMLDRLGLARLPDALDHGLDSRLGERGAGVSGGEAQRLALARTLLAEPKLLVLDEPTASLDADNEQRVLNTLATMGSDMTIVMFTHSPEAAAAADRRLEMRAGVLHAPD